MKREAKPKKVLSGRTKLAEVRAAKVLSGGTKLSEIRDATGRFAGQSRPDAKLSGLLKELGISLVLIENGSISVISRKKPKATDVGPDVTEYATVLAHAVDTFGSRIKANAWLNRPNRNFNNKSPLQVLTQDPSAVEEELVRIDHGIVA